MPPQLSPELVAGLLETDTGTIGHFVDAGFMDIGIQAKMPGAKIAGTAVTVRVTVPDSIIGHYALKFIRPGDILIIDRGQDRETACWGGTTSVGAAKAGLTGLIMDSAGNDISEANAAGLPIWCRGVTPVTTKYRGLGGALNVPISCGGVSINPGDAVLADESRARHCRSAGLSSEGGGAARGAARRSRSLLSRSDRRVGPARSEAARAGMIRGMGWMV